MKRIGGILAAAAIALMSGCAGFSQTEQPPVSTAQPLPLAEAERVYVIEPAPGRQWLTDRDGNPVEAEQTFSLIYDQLTHQPQYKVRMRRILTGQVDDGGMPLYRSESALYSLAGECLADFDEVLYEGAMGRYVIRRDYADEFDSMAELPEDYTTALIDGLTQQVVLQDVLQLKALDEHRLIALDPRRCLLGVVDDQAQILAGFPAEQDYHEPECSDGYIIAATDDVRQNSPSRQDVVLDAQLNRLDGAERINSAFRGLRGAYYIRIQDQDCEIVRFADQSEVYRYTDVSSLTYFDGQRLIRQRTDPETGAVSMVLADTEDHPLFQADQIISLVAEDQDQPADGFAAVSDEVLMRIDRDGHVQQTTRIDGLNAVYCDREGYLFYEVISEAGQLKMGILDENLNLLVPASDYDTVAAVSLMDYGSQALDAFFGYINENGQEKIDILNLNGEVIFARADRITSRGQDRFAVVRGNQAGLIDQTGAWLVQCDPYALNWDD